MNNIWKNTLLIVGIILLDQFLKGAVQVGLPPGEMKTLFSETTLRLIHGQGEKAAFPIPYSHNFFLALLSILAILWTLYRLIVRRQEQYLNGLPYALACAGFTANLIDWLLYGHIVNIFIFGETLLWAFNPADFAIALAVLMAIVNAFPILRWGRKGN